MYHKVIEGSLILDWTNEKFQQHYIVPLSMISKILGSSFRVLP